MSKGKWSMPRSNAESIYWGRGLDWAMRRLGFQPCDRPTPEVVALAWERAKAIDKRHKRMKARQRRRSRGMV